MCADIHHFNLLDIPGCDPNWQHCWGHAAAVCKPDCYSQAGTGCLNIGNGFVVSNDRIHESHVNAPQVELSSFQSIVETQSKSPFKSFPWKTGAIHFRFLPVSDLTTAAITTCLCFLRLAHMLSALWSVLSTTDLQWLCMTVPWYCLSWYNDTIHRITMHKKAKNVFHALLCT